MKRTIAWLLVVLMAVGMLAGCGAKEAADSAKETTAAATDTVPATQPQQAQPAEPTQPTQSAQPQPTQPTQPTQQEVAVGTVLNAPEVAVDSNIEDLYIFYTYPGDGQTESMEIIMDQLTADTYAVYVSNGLLKLNEIVYEVTDNGITKYYKDTFMEAFAQETSLSQDALAAEVNGVMELLMMFMLASPELQGVQYRKSDAIPATLTGDAFVYDLIAEGEVIGQVCVDKATGLAVRLTDSDGNAAFNVTQIKTTNVQVPAYK